MDDFLLKISKKYTNDQKFGEILRDILNDEYFLDYIESDENDFIKEETGEFPVYYRKKTMLLEKLKNKYL